MNAPRTATLLALVLGLSALPSGGGADVPVPVPPDQRGRLDAERSGFHDAANIRTVFWNFGMVGDYPADPGNVDLSVFHSVEVPKGTGMNYSDGITPFVLTPIHTRDGQDVFLMETGFRERQQISPQFNRVMRFEPRPGYFEPDPNVNQGRSPALSNDPRTWPRNWPDRLDDPDDPGWAGSWNGYFGKRPAADQESFSVMDDEFYDAWQYSPDSRDPTRHGLGLRVEVRGFQWSNPQAGNVIFWHYDIVNESTTDYDSVVFGLYMDSGVGGSALSCDGIFESDDDNAFFDKSSRLNLVYTWDRFGHGRDLNGSCSRTGYLGYAYLETPGNPFDGIDNDEDGITDELRDGGPGTQIIGQDSIRAYVTAHYDLARFEAAYGPLENRGPFRIGSWWTGDEDMDWLPEFHDVGADGVADTHDTGEGDGIPTAGEPNFDRTDLNESDQIGLTGFKMNRIKAGAGNPDPTTDGILFYTDANTWPARLYSKFTDPYAPARFDSALAANYNIGFLFASGPFALKAGKRERFSLALAFGSDLAELRTTVGTVQQIYNANYQFAVPPPMPTLTAETGDKLVRLSWDDVAERGVDPVSGDFDFEGYKIARPSRTSASRGDHHQPRRRYRTAGARDPVRPGGRHSRDLHQGGRRRPVLSGRRDRDHPHLDRHHGGQRPGVLLWDRRLRFRRRLAVRLAPDLPVAERDRRDPHGARRDHPAQERGPGAPQSESTRLPRRHRRPGGPRGGARRRAGVGGRRQLVAGARGAPVQGGLPCRKPRERPRHALRARGQHRRAPGRHGGSLVLRERP
jgi:hypothetical protein